jgi:glycosyltransferase involved in cell wall biosynthesis
MNRFMVKDFFENGPAINGVAKKRILLDFERMEGLYTGFYYFNLHFGKSLLKLAQHKFDFSFYLVQSQFGMFGENARYESSKSYAKPKNSFLNFFRKKSHAEYDIIHISDQHSRIRPVNNNSKKLLTIHDLNYLVELNNPKDFEEERKNHQKILDIADHVVCVSNFSKKTVLDNLDTKGKPVDVIYQGCELSEFETVDKPNYVPQGPFLFAMSNVLPKKNFHVLPCLLKGNKYELIISGIIEHGPQKEYVKVIMENARLHGVQDRVIITGPVSNEERQWYYKNCIAFMFPSIAEGFGTPPLEAMYFGKPVFASTHTSVPEVCGDVAYYFKNFEPSEMIKTFNEGMHHYETFKQVQKLKDRYHFFNWDKTAMEYIKLYEKL